MKYYTCCFDVNIFQYRFSIVRYLGSSWFCNHFCGAGWTTEVKWFGKGSISLGVRNAALINCIG